MYSSQWRQPFLFDSTECGYYCTTKSTKELLNILPIVVLLVGSGEARRTAQRRIIIINNNKKDCC